MNEAQQSKILLQHKLATKLSTITNLLYDTEVTPETLVRQVRNHLADDIYFKDPWQEGGGVDRYILGMKGFHAMLNFTFNTYQVGVTLEEKKSGQHFREARAMIDGVMNLQQFSWIYTYPLRTILVYKLRVYDDEHFEIYRHEEMWSFGGILHLTSSLLISLLFHLFTFYPFFSFFLFLLLLLSSGVIYVIFSSNVIFSARCLFRSSLFFIHFDDE